MHGIGLIMSLCGAIPLVQSVQQSDDPRYAVTLSACHLQPSMIAVAPSVCRHFWGVLVYLFTLLGMYASSTLGHSFFMYRRTANVFRMIDHSAIYILIAGKATALTALTALH